MGEAEARRKEKPQELATKKMQAVLEELNEPEAWTEADDFEVDCKAAAPKDYLIRVLQYLRTREKEQKVKLELENERTQDHHNALKAT